MIHYLLLYQFPFLYCVSIALGLVVYGSDFDELAGKLFLVPLLLLPVLHWFTAKLVRPLSSRTIATSLLMLGAILVLFVYQKLHFAFWDEHSLTQSVMLVVSGILSYLASIMASIRLSAWQGDHRKASTGAWLVLGIAWLLAFYYPMSSLFIMAAIMAVACLWPVAGSSELQLLQYKKNPVARPVKYLVFLLSLDLGLVLWDYQVNTGWAWHLAAAFIAGALGSWLAFNSIARNYWMIVIIAIGNFIVAVIWPAYVLHYMHSALVGLCLGWSIVQLGNFQQKPAPILVVSGAMPMFLGLAIGNLFYANIAYVHWRVVFLLPLLMLLFFKSSNANADRVETVKN
ncbi:hypothetical protein [Kaarinaea lacus]